MAYHNKIMLEAIGDCPLITISAESMNLPGIQLRQSAEQSHDKIYRLMLQGAKLATTDYIAVVEADSLYPREHFLQRPNKNKIGYNMNHWSLFTWGEPIYSWRNRRGNYSMLSYRKLVIEALEERFSKYPNGTPDRITGEIGRSMVERNIGITLRDVEEFETTVSIINFNHSNASDDLQIRQRKSLGEIRAYDIPYWRRAENLVKKWI